MNNKSEVLERRDPLIGQSIGGRFVIERRLDEGGFGSVYLASDAQLLGRRVVIKVLLETLVENTEARRKFDHEKEALTRLDHPGIVNIFDAGTLPDGKPYLVMPYIEGRTLESFMKESAPLPLSFCAKVVEDLTGALSAAHTKGVLHRDVKPSNIILTEQADGTFRTRLIDFGIARVNDSKISPVTKVEKVQGTLWYMSPEQLLGKLEQSPSVDIFSCAAVFYEMLTGKLPFNPQSVYEMYLLHQEGVKQRVTELRTGIPDEVDELILRGLAFDPEQRPKEICQFGKALASFLLARAGKTDHQMGEYLLQTIKLQDFEGFARKAGRQFDENVPPDKKTNGALSETKDQNVFAGVCPKTVNFEEPSEASFSQSKNRQAQDVNAVRLTNLPPPEIEDSAEKKGEKRGKKRFFPRLLIWSGLVVWALVMLIGGKIAIGFFRDGKPSSESLITSEPAQKQVSNSANSTETVLPGKNSKLNETPAALSYHLSVLRLHGKNYEEPLRTDGEGIFFEKYDEARIVLKSASDGYLYLFNETKDKNGSPQYGLVYPIKGLTSIEANKSVSTESLISDGRIGTDKIWVIWTSEKNTELEKAREAGIKDGAFIKDKNAVAGLQKFLEDHAAQKTEVVKDEKTQQTIIKHTGGTVTHSIELENR